MQSESERVSRYLPTQQRFGEDVGSHVISRAVDYVDGPILDRLTNKVEAYVDVFGARVVVVIRRESQRGLIVAE